MVKKLTKCLNEKCPLGYNCLRRLAPNDPTGQSFAVFMPEGGIINEMPYINCKFYIRYEKKEQPTPILDGKK